MSMRSDNEIKLDMTARMARLLERSPKSMSWVLARYRETEKVDEATIARQLGIDEHQLHHLALCGRPREYLFAEDIESIAEHIGIEQLPLASIVRRVEALETFRTYQNVADTGMLAAARDRAAEESGEYDVEPETTEEHSTSEPDDEQ